MDIYQEEEEKLAYGNRAELIIPASVDELLSNKSWKTKLTKPVNIAAIAGAMLLSENLDDREVLDKALTDPAGLALLRYILAPSPSRQGFHERVAARYLDDVFADHMLATGHEAKFLRLNNNGNSTIPTVSLNDNGVWVGCAVHLTPDGHLSLTRHQGNGASKTLDGIGYTRTDRGHNIFLYTIKYTKDGGGGQDNQRYDVQNTLSKLKAKGSILDAPNDTDLHILRTLLGIDDTDPMTVYAVGLCDGEYYRLKQGAKRKLILASLPAGPHNTDKIFVIDHTDMAGILLGTP